MPSAELFEEVEAGRVALGGCVVAGGDPNWHCKDCEHDWRSRSQRSGRRRPRPMLA
jgi:hypothetical protein